ncbi:cupredoxin domain-containing protein [Haloglomus litoreum]|uniref:cupredoxin domain-containing protein n=1 Tax=Haloglomus litoreum TaxID=3034026 RepID=UPI0023E8C1A5|nr:plastocyanin/azurin family copper-binding protein [Haloglomus sp. DT116]
MDRTTDGASPGRRTLLKAIGATTAIPLVGGAGAAAQQGGGDGRGGDGRGDGDRGRDGDRNRCRQQGCIHPFSGFTVLPGEYGGIERPVSADYTVETHVELADAEAPCGGFMFDPAGLAVRPGETVLFEGVDNLANGRIAGDHTVTAYAEAFDRQRRIPEAATPFSSPMIGPEVSWLYRFEEPGVYDIYCGPHEELGMVMRVVVGDETATDFGETAMPSEENPDPTPIGPFGAANTVFANLDPEAIVENGAIPWSDDLCSSPS